MSHFTTYRNARSKSVIATILAILLQINFLGFAAAAKSLNSRSKPAAGFETQAAYIRQIAVAANDVVYSTLTQRLYVSSPSSSGISGNCIRRIDPISGVVEDSTFVGSEPTKLALADDGHSLWVALDGAAAFRRYDVVGNTLGTQFPIGSDSFYGTYSFSDIAVAPGNPDLVAIARDHRGVSPPEAGVAVFDNGVQRPTTTPGHSAASDFLTFSASAATLYGGGFSSGLNTMTINASGVSITSTASFASGNEVRFDNGRVYGTVGQVINPATGTIVGTFPGVAGSPFTTDSGVGRAFYLTGGQSATNYTLTLKAFDLNTFLSVGSLSIPGVNGNPGALVRWGSNGLAFRTDGGQLFLIQTDLIPSGDPVPSPTPTPTPSPTPSPSPVELFVKSVSLNTADLVYSQSTQLIYASLPSSAGSNGNSIAPINPDTGAVGTPVFVGSEPARMAISNDGQTIYVALDGAASIRKFDVPTQTAGVMFPINVGYPLFANDLAVAPGDSNAVAVSRSNRLSFGNTDGIAIYDNGVRRTNVSNINTFYVEYSNVASKLYSEGSGSTAGSGALDRLGADANGVSYLSKVLTITGGDLRYDNGLLYCSGGDVIDPEAGASAIKGSFRNVNGLSSGDVIMTTDSTMGRAYFLSSQYGSGTAVLKVYDLNTYVTLGTVSFDIPVVGFSDRASSLVRWGTNGLAFRTANGVFLIQSNLINPTGSVPTPTPTPSPTPSPSPSPYVPTFVRQITMPSNDIVYNQPDQTIYSSVPSFAGANGNSITAINPQTGVLGTSVFIGSEPNRLALSDDGSNLHVSLDGAAAIRRFNIPTQTPATQFTWGTAQQRPIDMAVVPGSPLALAVSDGFSAAVYDEGVRRPNTSSGPASGVSLLAFGAIPSVLYGYGNDTLVKFTVDANGVTGSLIGSFLFSGFSNAPMQFANGRLYQGARAVDPEAGILTGTFLNTGGSNPARVVDPVLGKAFFLSSIGNGSMTLRVLDSNTFVPLGSIDIPSIPGAPKRLVRWGTNGLAFNTVPEFGQSDTSVNHTYILQSALVSNTGSIPTGVQLVSDKFSVVENSSIATLQVNRNGDVSGITTVNYSTTDITATAGTDYTTTSGTLTFAPGELSKTIAVPVIDDSFYEGPNETFQITLSQLNGAVFSGAATGVVTIFDNEFKPTMSITSSVSVLEGNSGTTQAVVNVSLSNATVDTVTVNYATSNSTAVAGSDYTATSGTLTFTPGVTTLPISVPVIGDTIDEPDEFFTVTLSNATNVNSFPQFGISVLIINDDGPPKLQFSSINYSVSEGAGRAIVTVNRFGRDMDPVTVDFQTSDGAAFQTRDYTIAAGTLQFAAGESTKTFSVLITDDGYFENNEFINLTLSNVTGNGASLGSPATSRVTILDNDGSPSSSNPIDDAVMFTRQHYYDFLSRNPDQAGLDYWSGQISQCGNDASCIRTKRIDVSNAFFYELEYQQTGSYVYRLYRAAYGNNQPFPNPFPNASYPNEEKKLPSYAVFSLDRARVRGGASLAQTQLDLANAFVQRAAFLNKYPASLDGPGFVDAILAAINTDTGVDLTSQRAALITLFNQGGRGAVLYRLADDNVQTNPIDNRSFIDAEYNRAFVVTQYFGYLRRNPDIAGFIFWLGQVNSAALRDVAKQHAMVCSFITATEYQQRFSSVVTHSNSECQ